MRTISLWLFSYKNHIQFVVDAVCWSSRYLHNYVHNVTVCCDFALNYSVVVKYCSAGIMCVCQLSLSLLALKPATTAETRFWFNEKAKEKASEAKST